MPASLVPNGKQQFIDINGAPLVGGTVGMYVPLTLTPQDTWQDAGQTILNTNPIVLDSRGQCIIYGSGAYRQIVKDEAENLIFDAEISDYTSTVFGPQDVIASATTTDLGTLGSNNALITGTATITSFGTSAVLTNPVYLIQFAGILTLTYNATSLIIPGADNITTAAGDCAMVEIFNSSGYWKVIAYFPIAASGALGTAASQNIGTSGANVPLLSTNNKWSGLQQFSAGTYGTEVVLSVSSNATTPNFALGNHFYVSISAGLTMNFPINGHAGQSGVLIVNQTAGSLGITWGSGFKASGGISNVNLSGVNGADDYFAYYYHSTTECIITPILNPT